MHLRLSLSLCSSECIRLNEIRRSLCSTDIRLSQLSELHLLLKLLRIDTLMSAVLDQVLELLLLGGKLGSLGMRDRGCLLLLLLLLLKGGELLLCGHLKLSLGHGRHLMRLSDRVVEVVLNHDTSLLALETLKRLSPRFGIEELVKLVYQYFPRTKQWKEMHTRFSCSG